MIVFAEYSNNSLRWCPRSPPVSKFRSAAAEELSALPNHVWCEGKLLAVQNKCGFVCLEVTLAVHAPVLEMLDPRRLLVDCMIVAVDVVAVVGDLRLVFGNSYVVIWDAVLESLRVDLQLDHSQAHGFECYHNLGFGFEGALVLVCVEDGVAHVKGIDGVLEGSAVAVMVAVILVVVVSVVIVSIASVDVTTVAVSRVVVVFAVAGATVIVVSGATVLAIVIARATVTRA